MRSDWGEWVFELLLPLVVAVAVAAPSAAQGAAAGAPPGRLSCWHTEWDWVAVLSGEASGGPRDGKEGMAAGGWFAWSSDSRASRRGTRRPNLSTASHPAMPAF